MVTERAVPDQFPLLTVTVEPRAPAVTPVAGTAAAVIDVLQVTALDPPLVVHCNALAAVEHDGIETAVGDAAPDVALTTTVFAPCVARPLSGSPVRFVAVPLLGVPKAPPFTTNAPAVPTFTPNAVATPVPGVVVAKALKDVPFVLVHVSAPDATSVQSPEAVTKAGTAPADPTRNWPDVGAVIPPATPALL